MLKFIVSLMKQRRKVFNINNKKMRQVTCEDSHTKKICSIFLFILIFKISGWNILYRMFFRVKFRGVDV